MVEVAVKMKAEIAAMFQLFAMCKLMFYKADGRVVVDSHHSAEMASCCSHVALA
jgi:hypothetical protein